MKVGFRLLDNRGRPQRHNWRHRRRRRRAAAVHGVISLVLSPAVRLLQREGRSLLAGTIGTRTGVEDVAEAATRRRAVAHFYVLQLTVDRLSCNTTARNPCRSEPHAVVAQRPPRRSTYTSAVQKSVSVCSYTSCKYTRHKLKS